MKRLIGARFSITGSVLVIAGIFLVIIPQKEWGELYRSALSGIGGAFIGSGGSMFVDAWSKGEALEAIGTASQSILDEIDATVRRASDHHRMFGIYDIHTPAFNYDYSDFMANAKEITLVFNDMKTWLNNHDHLEVIRNRIKNKNQTNIYMMHPDSSLIDFIGDISNKIGKDGKNRQVDDIKSAVKKITNGFSKEEMCNLVLKGHFLINTYTLVMSESECLVVYYPIAMRYNNGVIWHFERGRGADNVYSAFEVDVKQIDRLCSYSDENILTSFFVE